MLSHSLPRVQAKADVFRSGTAPSQTTPRPPQAPSPCSVCAACLPRQRIPYTTQGAVPMSRLQGSRLLLLRPCCYIETQHLLPQLSASSSSPVRSQVPSGPKLPPRSRALKGGGGGVGEGEVARQCPHQGLHLEGPDGTFGFWPSLSPAHRPTEQRQQQQQSERPEQGAQGHDRTRSEHRGTKAGRLFGCRRPGRVASAPGQTGVGGSQGASSSSCGPPSTLSPPPGGKNPQHSFPTL